MKAKAIRVHGHNAPSRWFVKTGQNLEEVMKNHHGRGIVPASPNWAIKRADHLACVNQDWYNGIGTRSSNLTGEEGGAFPKGADDRKALHSYPREERSAIAKWTGQENALE